MALGQLAPLIATHSAAGDLPDPADGGPDRAEVIIRRMCSNRAIDPWSEEVAIAIDDKVLSGKSY
jgi:hypothetical protein